MNKGVTLPLFTWASWIDLYNFENPQKNELNITSWTRNNSDPLLCIYVKMNDRIWVCVLVLLCLYEWSCGQKKWRSFLCFLPRSVFVSLFCVCVYRSRKSRALTVCPWWGKVFVSRKKKRWMKNDCVPMEKKDQKRKCFLPPPIPISPCIYIYSKGKKKCFEALWVHPLFQFPESSPCIFLYG